ncbi:MAG TPA: PEGA domain-containing protein [Pyrinomonadaceae bacterium]|nr:PEGA domain-containing protein [Pyrinomonadaceae bacterium]
MSKRLPTPLYAPARRALAAATLLALLLMSPAAPAAAKGKQRDRKNQPTTGRVEISTNPAGYPVIIDGVAAGETTEYVRAIELEPGEHTIEILFPNNTRWQQTFNVAVGRRFCVALNYRPQTISVPAVPASPCPYPVNVSAPATINDGDIVTFSADVGYAGPSGLNYTWTVSPPTARILTGAGTPTITVDSAGLGGRRVTAILVVDDGSGDRACRQSAQAQTNVVAQRIPEGPKRFDEFPSVAFDDDKARLDNLAIELQNSPGAQGYVIAYAGRRSRPGEAERMGDRAVKYLTQTRGISGNRLVFVNGGYRDSNSYELWLVPQGADTPRATPTLSPSELRRQAAPRRGRE